MGCFLFFFFKQKTAYEMRISDWSSDVCSSDLGDAAGLAVQQGARHVVPGHQAGEEGEMRLAGREAQVLGAGAAQRLHGGDAAAALLDAAGDPRRRIAGGVQAAGHLRSEGRRVGQECVSTCRSRRLPCHKKKYMIKSSDLEHIN